MVLRPPDIETLARLKHGSLMAIKLATASATTIFFGATFCLSWTAFARGDHD